MMDQYARLLALDAMEVARRPRPQDFYDLDHGTVPPIYADAFVTLDNRLARLVRDAGRGSADLVTSLADLECWLKRHCADGPRAVSCLTWGRGDGCSMRLLDRLFGNSQVAGKPARTGLVVREGDSLRISGIDFYGQYAVSANGQFTFGWCDSDMDVGSSGRTRNVSGRYVLVEGQRVVLTGQMQRPNDGRVANNGTFAVCDWMFTTAIKSTFRVIDRSGNPLIAHLFKANLYRCGISDDGQWAVCQTCNADNRDGNKLTFFEVLSGKLLWQIEPLTGWADNYKFDVEERLLYSSHRDKGDFAYRVSGEFLDAQRWRNTQIEHGRGWEALAAVSELLDEARSTGVAPDYVAVLAMLEQTRERSKADDADMQAQVERAIAETYDAQEKFPEAIQHYEVAIRLNPKVVAKRRLDALRKRLDRRQA